MFEFSLALLVLCLETPEAEVRMAAGLRPSWGLGAGPAVTGFGLTEVLGLLPGLPGEEAFLLPAMCPPPWSPGSSHSARLAGASWMELFAFQGSWD